MLQAALQHPGCFAFRWHCVMLILENSQKVNKFMWYSTKTRIMHQQSSVKTLNFKGLDTFKATCIVNSIKYIIMMTTSQDKLDFSDVLSIPYIKELS